MPGQNPISTFRKYAFSELDVPACRRRRFPTSCTSPVGSCKLSPLLWQTNDAVVASQWQYIRRFLPPIVWREIATIPRTGRSWICNYQDSHSIARRVNYVCCKYGTHFRPHYEQWHWIPGVGEWSLPGKGQYLFTPACHRGLRASAFSTLNSSLSSQAAYGFVILEDASRCKRYCRLHLEASLSRLQLYDGSTSQHRYEYMDPRIAVVSLKVRIPRQWCQSLAGDFSSRTPRTPEPRNDREGSIHLEATPCAAPFDCPSTRFTLLYIVDVSTVTILLVDRI